MSASAFCHQLVAYRAGGLAEPLPVRRVSLHLETVSPCVSLTEGVSPLRTSADDDHPAVRVAEFVGEDSVTFCHHLSVVAVIARAGYYHAEGFHYAIMFGNQKRVGVMGKGWRL